MSNLVLYPKLILGLIIGIYFLSALCSNEVTLSEHELLSSDFDYRYGPGNFSRVDIAGPGIRFDFIGLSSSATGVSDNYPIKNIGQIIPSHGNGDFSNVNSYKLMFTNLGDNAVEVSLIMNTGFTGPSGNPSNDLTNDTFWRSDWVKVSPHQIAIPKLDFDAAIPCNIKDNEEPHTPGTNGIPSTINTYDRTEVSNIGFQIIGGGNARILVQPYYLTLPWQTMKGDVDEKVTIYLNKILQALTKFGL
jgi:hypothetical protein